MICCKNVLDVVSLNIILLQTHTFFFFNFITCWLVWKVDLFCIYRTHYFLSTTHNQHKLVSSQSHKVVGCEIGFGNGYVMSVRNLVGNNLVGWWYLMNLIFFFCFWAWITLDNLNLASINLIFVDLTRFCLTGFNSLFSHLYFLINVNCYCINFLAIRICLTL